MRVDPYRESRRFCPRLTCAKSLVPVALVAQISLDPRSGTFGMVCMDMSIVRTMAIVFGKKQPMVGF